MIFYSCVLWCACDWGLAVSVGWETAVHVLHCVMPTFTCLPKPSLSTEFLWGVVPYGRLRSWSAWLKVASPCRRPYWHASSRWAAGAVSLFGPRASADGVLAHPASSWPA